MIQAKSQDLRTSGASKGNHIWGQGKMRCSSSSNEAGKRWLIPASTPFCSSQAPQNWMMPTHIGEGDLLIPNPQIHRLISPRNNLTDTPWNNACQLSGHSLAQSSWQIKLTITLGKDITKTEFASWGIEQDNYIQSSWDLISSYLNKLVKALCLDSFTLSTYSEVLHSTPCI